MNTNITNLIDAIFAYGTFGFAVYAILSMLPTDVFCIVSMIAIVGGLIAVLNSVDLNNEEA